MAEQPIARVMPHSLEAEQAVLGGMMLDVHAWDNVVGKVVEQDFYKPEHRAIFRAIVSLVNKGEPIDVITVSDALQLDKKFATAEVLQYLSQLAHNTPGAANIATYADIVRERAILRHLISVGNDIAGNAFEHKSAAEALDYAESQVFAIAAHGERHVGEFKTIGEVLQRAVGRIQELHTSGTAITGATTGFDELDRLTSGLQKSDLVIVAGRPSMGKTSFAMNIAEHVSIISEKPVLIFSMEMPAEQLVMRMLSSLGRVELQRIRSGQLRTEDWPRLASAVGLLENKKIFIDDTGSLSPADVRARARRVAREQGELAMILIDYLQLMRVPGSNENRTAEISEISRSLKALARELNVPVVALSQLNRSLENRVDRRPIMSDLRESGAIEQDADLIAFIYRDEIYNKDSPQKGSAEIIIGKQRNGPIGMIRLNFLGHYSKFENHAKGALVEVGNNAATFNS
jgi:replicative DNA helicase